MCIRNDSIDGTGRVWHVFQCQYKAILVQMDSYLLKLTRFVVLNPVRAGMVEDVGDWSWSSFGAVMGHGNMFGWLETDWLLRSLEISVIALFVSMTHG